MKRLLLWDIDGTLLLTDGAGLRGMTKASRALYGQSFRWDGIRVSGKLDPIIFEEALALNGRTPSDDDHRRFSAAYLTELARELDEVRKRERARTMPGIRAACAALLARGAADGDVTQGIVTGNYGRAAVLKLEACGLDPAWFEVCAFGDEGRTRPDLVALAMKRYAARYGVTPSPRAVVVVGDTPLDVACAKAHGCVAFAVATGAFSVNELEAAGADVTVRDLEDPAPLFAALAG